MNFYEILELDENEINSKNIEKKIEEKRKIWNKWRNQGSLKQQELAKEYLSKISEIEKIIIDSNLREKHRKEFINKNRQKRKEAFEELDNIIMALSSNEMPKKQFEILKSQFKNILNEEEIKKRLSKSKITIITSEHNNSNKKAKPKLESSKEKEINELLSLLGKKDLYDFLSLSKNSSLQLLQNRAEEIWKESKGKTDIENSRKNKLAGEAKSIFSSSLNKEKYDNVLSTQHLKKLDKTLNVITANKILTQENISQLLKIAKKYGILEDEAQEYIEEVANKKKCSIIGSFAKINIKSCVFCGEIIENEHRCPGCGEEVIQKCPNCSKNIKITEKTCKNCGFAIADLKEIKKLLNNTEILISLNKYEEAEQVLNQIIKIWNLQKAKEKLKDISLKKNEETLRLKEIENLINQNLYKKANEKLLEYIKLYPSNENIKKLENDIKNTLKKVKSLSKEMEKYKQLKNYSLVIKKYEEICSLVKDYEEAKKILQNLPLTVDNISYNKISNNLKIGWEFPLNGFSFLVVKKEKSPPLKYDDGKLVANTRALEVIDTEFEEGKIFYYSIFLVKDNIKFVQGKTLGPVFIPKPIKNVLIKGVDTKIELKWEIPEYCEEVEIYKKQTNNKFTKKNAKLIKPTTNFYIDNDVKNNLTYGYMFIGKYKDPITNKIIHSEETFFFTTPAPLPKPLENYDYKIENKKLFIDFKNNRENIVFAIIEEKPPFSSKEILNINNIQKYKLYNPVKNTIQIPLKTQGNIYIVPFSIKNEIAIVGEIKEITFIEDVKNLKTQYKNSQLYIYFIPPAGAKHFLLTYSYDKFTNKIDNSINKKIYSIEEYNKNGGYLVLDINNETPHYLCLYVYDKKNNNVSKGVQFLEYCGKKLKIKYKVKKIKKFIFFGSYKEVFIELETDVKDNFELKDILIFFKKESVPLDKKDGIKIRKMKKVKFENGIGRISIPKKYWNSKGYIKLFFEDNDNFNNIRLLPDREEKLKL